VWTEYRRRRASAYSSSPRDPRRRTGASDHEGAALRLATPASPFALEPTFVVVEIACTEGSASHTAWVLAEIVEGSERGNGTVEVEFYLRSEGVHRQGHVAQRCFHCRDDVPNTFSRDPPSTSIKLETAFNGLACLRYASAASTPLVHGENGASKITLGERFKF